MKKFFSAFALLAWLLTSFGVNTSFASVGVQDDNGDVSQATDLDFGADLDVTNNDSRKTIDLDQTLALTSVTTTGDLTFQSSVLAGGRIGASSTIPSSSNGINPSTLPYSVLLKSIGNVAGETATLPNGTSGQILAIQINGCGPSGTWIVSRTKGSGWTTLTFNAKGDTAVLMYDATLGWILLSSESVTIAQTAL